MAIVTIIATAISQAYAKFQKYHHFKSFKELPEDTIFSRWMVNKFGPIYEKYRNETLACSQKLICWYVQESVANVKSNKANRLEMFVEGFSR